MSQVFPSPLCYTDIEEDIFYMGFHTERVGGSWSILNWVEEDSFEQSSG